MCVFTSVLRIKKNLNIQLVQYSIVKNCSTVENIITVFIPDTSILSKVSYFDIHSINNVTDDVMTILKGRINAEMDVTRP